MPETAPPRSRIWLRPPDLKTPGRLGFAQRRSLSTETAGLVTALGFAAAFGCSLGAAATCVPAVAGALGAAPFFGSLSSLAAAAGGAVGGLGARDPGGSLARGADVEG